jgi:tetratricopeptide (TPR) repeat protein
MKWENWGWMLALLGIPTVLITSAQLSPKGKEQVFGQKEKVPLSRPAETVQDNSLSSIYHVKMGTHALSRYKSDNNPLYLQMAFNEFQKANDQGCKHPTLFHNWGLALELSGKVDEALDSYQMALKLSNNDPETMIAVAQLLVFADRSEESLSYLDQLVEKKLDPRNNLEFILGRAHQKMGESEKAIVAYIGELEKRPGNHKARRYMGESFMNSGKLELALEIYGKIPEDAGTNYLAALFHGASIKERQGKYQEAIDLLSKVKMRDSYSRKGYLSDGQLVQIDQNYWTAAQYRIGKNFLLLNNHHKAKQYLERVPFGDPFYSRAQDSLDAIDLIRKGAV